MNLIEVKFNAKFKVKHNANLSREFSLVIIYLAKHHF